MSQFAQKPNSEKKLIDRLGLWVLLVFVLLFLVRLWFLAHFPLTGDEAYHWEWSRHPALGYYDHPPLTAYVIWVFTKIFGTNLLGVRFGALFFSSIILLAFYFLGKRIYGEKVGFYGFLVGAFCPIFTVGALMMTTDPAYLGFYVLGFSALYFALFEDRKFAWYLSGICFGLSLLAKFLALFYLPSLLFFLIISKTHRYWLKRKEPYLMALISGIGFLPVIYWNATHEWATFAFNLANRHKGTGINLIYPLEYLVGEAIVLSPLVFFPLIYILARFLLKPSRFPEKEKLVLSFALAPIGIFGFFSLFERVGWHWPASGFFPGILAFANYFLSRGRKAKTYLNITIGLMLLGILGIYFVALRPDIIPKVQYKFDSKFDTQYLREYYGWSELGDRLNQILADSPAETFLISRAYPLSAQLSFYTPNRPFCHLFGKGGVYGRNYFYWTDWEKLKGKDAVYIALNPIKGSEEEMLKKAFQEVRLLEELPIYYRNNRVRSFYLYYCVKFIYNPYLAREN